MATKEQLNLVNVRIRFTLGAYRAECVQWWREDSPGFNFASTNAQLANFGNLVGDQLDSGWQGNRPPSSVRTESIVTQYRTSGPPGQAVYVQNAAGTASTDLSMSPQLAVCISYRTGFVGRSYRGRNYLPFIASDSDTVDFSGEVPYLQGSVMTDLANTYPVGLPLNDGGAGSHNMVLVVYSPTLGVATPVESVTVNQYFDTQRRRAGQT